MTLHRGLFPGFATLTPGFYEAGSRQVKFKAIGSRFYPSCRDRFHFAGPSNVTTMLILCDGHFSPAWGPSYRLQSSSANLTSPLDLNKHSSDSSMVRLPGCAITHHGPTTNQQSTRHRHDRDLLSRFAVSSDSFIDSAGPRVVAQSGPTDFH